MTARLLPAAMLATLAALATPMAGPAAAQASASWSAPASGPGRFTAVHGRRALVMGYPATGLEVWAYPLQLLSNYQVRFIEAGRVEPLDGRALLNRIETSPSEVVRVYVGPDFVVRERLFVPLDAPGAMLSYEVEGRPDVRIVASFRPSLNLMWPGAIGGQSVSWDAALDGYVEREPLHGFSAVIRSPQAVAHDTTVNSATERPEDLGLVLEPKAASDGIRRAELFVAADDPATKSGAPLAETLEHSQAELRAQSAEHYADLRAQATEIVTPDEALDRALAASVIALDQAWVCEPALGCGEVAGYGPSRPGRRPQYAWYFAGDGLVAVEGLLAAGRYERAREELEFIARYQNKSNGMIWHEMSLSAPLIDWQRRYPYMFVHVDITLQYLATLADYMQASDDVGFLKTHWQGIEAAWRYARALVDPNTGLPAIPPGKEGQDEQTVLRDDVRLTTAWVEAADGFEKLARLAGRGRLADDARRSAEAARAALRATGWDAERNFWLGGHTVAGAPVHDERPDAADVVLLGAFTPQQVDAALARIATPQFQSDWGVRSLSDDAPNYDPNAYSLGSVWGLGTSSIATTFWKAHRPLAAWSAWRGLEAWTTLDSPGHMHEVTAGDLFHPELESVPEQTWSSAGFLTGMTQGLLGLELHAERHALTFAPHLPGAWNHVAVRRLRLGEARLDLSMSEDAGAISLDLRNDGAPAAVDFDPQIPLGAHLLGAEIGGSPIAARLERRLQDQHADASFTAAKGETRVVIRYAGGVRLIPLATPPEPGDASSNLKLADARLDGRVLKVEAWAADPRRASVDFATAMSPQGVTGGQVAPLEPGRYRLTFDLAPAAQAGRYVRVQAAVTFADSASSATPSPASAK